MNSITTEGNLTSDPRLNYTSTGKAVANLRIAVSERRKDRDGDYVDTPAVFYDVTVWGGPAENVAESLTTGDRVLVMGRSWVEEYRDTVGELRRKNVIEATAIGTSLRYATARPVKPSNRSTTPADEEAGLRLLTTELVDEADNGGEE